MELKPIGFVKSPVKDAVDENWGEVVSEIRLDPAFAGGLKGLDQFSHIQVIFFMDRATWDPATDMVRRPRGREDMPLVGVFAQRARHRPNPIGITTVALLGISGGVLTVRELDALDGTPVLDIKPYNPGFDKRDNAKVPDWVLTLMKGYF